MYALVTVWSLQPPAKGTRIIRVHSYTWGLQILTAAQFHEPYHSGVRARHSDMQPYPQGSAA